MATDEDQPTQIQRTVDKAKAISLLQNVHKLAPSQSFQEQGNPVAIVDALKSDSILLEAYLQLTGYFINPLNKKLEAYRIPVMNSLGIGNFISVVGHISKTYEFAYISEDELPKLVLFLYKQNYPYFTVYCDLYDLEKSDFNLISTLLFNTIFTALSKGKNAKYINTVGRTYSEDFMGKVLNDRGNKGVGFTDKLTSLNPFKKK